MFCLNCGREVQEGAVVCEFCGASVGPSETLDYDFGTGFDELYSGKIMAYRITKAYPKRRQKNRRGKSQDQRDDEASGPVLRSVGA